MTNRINKDDEGNDDFTHPLMSEREVKKVLLIPVAGDKGLCGDR